MVKKLFSVIAFLFIFINIGCGCMVSTSEADVESVVSEDNIQNDTGTFRHYTISLSMYNYNTFFGIEYSSGKSAKLIVSGVLTFAYYENVVVTALCTYKYSSPFGNMNCDNAVYTAETEINLNAAGNGTVIFSTDYIPDNIKPEFTDGAASVFSKSFEIIDVEGTILFTV